MTSRRREVLALGAMVGGVLFGVVGFWVNALVGFSEEVGAAWCVTAFAVSIIGLIGWLNEA